MKSKKKFILNSSGPDFGNSSDPYSVGWEARVSSPRGSPNLARLEIPLEASPHHTDQQHLCSQLIGDTGSLSPGSHGRAGASPELTQLGHFTMTATTPVPSAPHLFSISSWLRVT